MKAMPRAILLVEDDANDALLVQRAFRKAKLANPIRVVEDGEQAIDYLRRGDSRPPCLILLDLNMPKMNGIEFLKVVKADENLRMIPVVVLTTSHEQRDIVESFELGVAGYMVKSADYAEAAQIIRMIDKYWTLSETPGQVVMS